MFECTECEATPEHNIAIGIMCPKHGVATVRRVKKGGK